MISLFTGASAEALGELSPEAKIGERLFSEPRFAHYFFAHSGGKVNEALTVGDPALDTLKVISTETSPIKGMGRGQSISCGSCHLGGEYRDQVGLPTKGVNLFGDFSERGPVPARADGRIATLRNTPPLVGLTVSRNGGWGLLHWDGEFASIEELIVGTYVGRNFGWLATEQSEARRHFARVIREDDGHGILAAKYGRFPYSTLLRGEEENIPAALRLPVAARFDPAMVTDEEILQHCARFVSTFVASLQYSLDQQGRYNGSPYDAFLAANHLPQALDPAESPPQYSRRLFAAVAALRLPRFIDDPSRRLILHDQPFRFGELELRGMKIFFRGTLGYSRTTSAGNCAECHVPPHFTDGGFHNTGDAQESYDAVHGLGAFAKLTIPSLAERKAEGVRWFRSSSVHPQGSDNFLSLVSAESPGQVDLGLWNIYANPDLVSPQSVIAQKLNHEGRLSEEEVLALTVGRFKTPTLRDLGQSAPYLHSGRLHTIEEVVMFYQRMSELAHAGKLRNAPSEFSSVQLGSADIVPLSAFLRALNEDYVGQP